MQLLRAATLTTADVDAAAARYGQWFDYETVERGVVDADLAASWDAPASTGAAYAVCRPASGVDIFLRFVEGAPEPAYQPLRSFGWAAVEICVQDTLVVHEQMKVSPFEVIGPPRALDGMPAIFPMQVKGPDQEIVFLTQINADPDQYALPRAETPIDRPFILVLACSDLAASLLWFDRALGIKAGFEGELTYTMINKALGLPMDQKHRIATGVYGQDCFLEFDQYPAGATPRPGTADTLKPGVAFATLKHPAFDTIEGDWIAPPVRRDGAVYGDARVGVLRAPDDTLIEIVEA